MSRSAELRPDAPSRTNRGSRVVGSAGRGGRRVPLVALGVAVLFSLLQLAGYSHTNFSNDSYRYARQSLEYLGHSRTDAVAQALDVYCSNMANRQAEVANAAGNALTPAAKHKVSQTCLTAGRNGLWPNAARYNRIFETRPGYPIVIAPAIAVFGVMRGMFLMDLLITVATALLLYALLRAVGGSTAAALAGQVLYLVSPLTFWSMHPLTEGLVNLCTVGALLGSWWLLERRLGRGAALLAGSLALLALVKYSTASLLAGALAVVGLVLLVRRRDAGVWILTGLNVLGAAVVTAVSQALALPGIQDSLQDTFTSHFDNPLVSDPWHRLIHLNRVYWPDWLGQQALAPMFLACVALSVWALFRRLDLGLMCLAVLGVGIGCAVLHPVTSQADRLWLLAWLPAVIGTALCLDRLPWTSRALRLSE